MTIDWQAAGVPSTGMKYDSSDMTFTNLLFNFLIPLEAPQESQRLTLTPVPITHKDKPTTYNLTIGVGFDLRAGGSVVQDAVFVALGLVPSVVAMATTNQALNTSDPNYAEEKIEYNYVTRLLNDINTGTQAAADDMTAVMQQRYNLLETNSAYQNFVNAEVNSIAEPGIVQHSQFAFNSDSEVYGVFETLWQNYYQPQIFKKIPLLEGTSFVGSREEEALADMLWNGGPGLLGHNLQNAINSGNGAEAWFQIRYESNGSGNLVNAGRRYYDAQVFGLYDNPSSPTESDALQAYQMLTANRAVIMKYELTYGSDPYSSNALTPSHQIAGANNSYGLNGTANQVQTLAQAFDAAANQEIEYLTSLYSTVLPSIQLNDTTTGGASNFSVRSVDFYAASATDTSVNASVSNAPSAEVASDASADHILLGSETGDTLIGGLGSDIFVAQAGNELLETGVGADTLIAANGNDTIQLGYQLSASAQEDVLDFIFPASSGSTETIVANNNSGLGALDVNGSALGGVLVASGSTTDSWTDQNGNTYQFISSTNSLTGYSPGQNTQAVGEMVITLGGAGGNQIDIWGFSLTQAEDLTSGFLGIHVPPTLSLTYAANAGVDPPAPNFTAGSTQSYTAWLDAPTTSAETITITLSGAPASDFGLVSGSSIVPINSNGTFTVTIAAGQTSAAFSLVNTGDVGAAANLQLVASMANPDNSTGQVISSTPVTQSYVEPSLDPFVDNATTTVAGTSETDTVSGFGYTQYTGGDSVGSSDQMILSSGHNYVTENGENDFITESATGNNIVFGSDVSSSNTILLNGASTVAQAITLVTAGGAASGKLGDAVATGDGNDTIVGGSGNSVYLLGQGSNVVYTGAGNDSVVGGYAKPYAAAGTYSQQFNWTTSVTATGEQSLVYGSTTVEVPSSYTFVDSGIGAEDSSSVIGSAAGSATVVAGNGDDFIGLPSGPGNYVVAGSGHDTIVGGDGGNTIFGGSGDSTILGGAGSDYIDTGSGNDLVADSGNGDTVIGGGGNDTIALSSTGTGNNYVDGGAGSDVIFGSGGSDTLIAGSGNSTILGGKGTESIVGGSGNDWLQGGTGNDTIEAAGSGNDTLVADPNSSATTYLYGGTGTDSIVGGGGTNVLYAGDGGTSAAPTTVLGGAGNTTIYGGLGVDAIQGGTGSTVIYAGDGGTSAAPTAVVAGAGNTTIYGGLGVDAIEGGSGTDVLYAGDGGDDNNPTTVIAGSGTETLYGGAGADVLEDTTGGADQLFAGSGDATLIGSGADTLTAGSGADYFSAASGNETYAFNAGFSDDAIAQSGGTATLMFGSGIANTDLSVTAVQTTDGQMALEIDDGGVIDVFGGLTGAVGSVAFAGGSTYSLDQLLDAGGVGDGSDQTLQGASGVMTFSVDDSAALNTDAAAADTISAWGRSDTVSVSQTNDEGSTVFVGGNSAQVTGGSGADSLTADGLDDSITAGSGDQVLGATGANDLLAGGSGQDTLTAKGTNDTLIAGIGIDTLIDESGGADTFVVNNTADVVQANSSTANDTIESSVSFTLSANINTLLLEGSSNVTGVGNADSFNLLKANSGNDTLIAGAGNDTLVAGPGNDLLVAGSGGDVLEGGAGSTTYALGSGFGHVEIEPGAGTGAIQFGTGISVTSLALGLTTDFTGSPALLIQDGSSSVIVDGGLAGSINQFAFADGSQLTLAQLLASANVMPGSIAGANGDGVINTTPNASLSGSGNDAILATGASDTLTAGVGTESLLVSGADASVIGGSGTETLVGAGNGDTVVGGNGNQKLAGFGTADVLVGGLGDDTLVGGAGYDTLIAGTGNTVMYGGAQADSIVLTAGSTVTYYPGSASATELIELPAGMKLADFTAVQGTNGDLILQSTSGDTTAIIKGFYGANSSGKLWMIADSAGDAEPLSVWAGSQGQPPSSYAQEIADLQQEFEANLTATLNQVGQQGGKLSSPSSSFAQGPGNEYQFNGVTTQNVTAQGGAANLGNSDSDQTTFTVTQTGSTSYTVTTPTYGEVTIPGWQDFIPDSSLTALQIETMDNESGVGNPYGLSIQATTDAGVQGFEVTQLPTTENVQTGTATTVETVPVYTDTYQETQSFTVYNVTGDGGNDVITAGAGSSSNNYNGHGVSTRTSDTGFVGTVITGNGNVSVNLGMSNVAGGPTQPEYYPSSGALPLGAFIEAGSGNDSIVGSGGADVIAAGTGFDQILAGMGSTVYVPFEGASTEYIYIQGPFYGGAPLPQSTLVLPDGITPQDLQYRLITNVPVPSTPDGSENLSGTGEELQITYGNSSVLLPFGFNESALYPAPSNGDEDGIDRFEFSDGEVLSRSQLIAMAGASVSISDFNPEVTPGIVNVSAGTTVQGGSLFSGSDSSGLPITWYQVSNTGTNGGYFELNGVAQTAGQAFDVSVDQLPELTYVAGTAGVDSIQVSAFDGVTWGSMTSFNVGASIGATYGATEAEQKVVGGSTGPDTLVGGYDGDTLVGSSGRDTFQYSAGGGAEVITEAVATSSMSANVLEFDAGITPSSLTLSAASGGELVLSTGGTGDSISIEGFNLLNPVQSFPIQSFQFSDGTSLTLPELLFDSAVTGTSGSIDNPDGSVTSYDFTPSNQLTYYAQNVDTSGNVTADAMVYANGYEVTDTYAYNADGSYIDTEVDTPEGGAPSTAVLRYNAANQLVSELDTNSDGSTGAYTYNAAGQTLTADVTNADGSTSDSKFVYSADGSYTDTVVTTPTEGGASTTTIQDYNANNQLMSELITNPDGSTDAYTYNAQGQVLAEDVTSANGVTSDSIYTYNTDGSSSVSDTVIGNSNNETLTGTASSDLLEAGTGNQLLVGGSGNETYAFGTGFGQDTIEANIAGASNTLQFLGDITESDVTFSSDGINVTLTMTGSTGADGQPSTITLPNHYVNGQPVNDIDEIIFGDGTTVSMSQINQLLSQSAADTIAVPDESSTVAGSGNEVFNLGKDDTLTLGSGTDTVNISNTSGSAGYNTILLGMGNAQINAGSNTENYYEANEGFGNATIVGSVTGPSYRSSLTFGAGILPQDIDVQQQGEDLVLNDTVTGHSIDFSGWYSNTDSELSTIDFADASIWWANWNSPSAPFNENLYASVGNESLTGTAGNDTLNSGSSTDTLAGGTGATTLIGGSGTDLMVAGTESNLMEGGSGTETYAFAPGFGNTVLETAAVEDGTNTIQFAAGIDPSQLSYAQQGANLVITVAQANGQSDTLVLANYFVDANSINSLSFADGPNVTSAQINQQFTEFATTSTGALQFASGNSTLVSTNGNDTLVANAAGMPDTLIGGTGTDLLVAGIGYTEMDGGTGTETYEINPGGKTPFADSVNGNIGQTLIQPNATEKGANILAFNGDITPSDLAFQQNGTALEVGITINSQFELVQVDNYFNANGQPTGNIQGLTFADGESLSLSSVNADLIAAPGRAFQLTPDGTEIYDGAIWAPASVTDGVEGDTVGLSQSNVTVIGGTGDDTYNLGVGDNLTLGTGSSQINSGIGDEIYTADANFGDATVTGIETNPGNQSSLNFGAGILSQDIDAQLQGSDLVLTDTLTGHSIDFSGWSHYSYSELSKITFADGSTWVPYITLPFSENLYASAGNESLVGGAGSDTLNSDNGVDTLVGGTSLTTLIGGTGTDLLVAGTYSNIMDGGSGTETYEFGEGFGQTTIDVAPAEQGANTIQFLAGIDASQLSYAQSGSNLIITVAESNGGTGPITVANHFVNGAPIGSDISELTFADGTSISMTQINQQLSTKSSANEESLANSETPQATAKIQESKTPSADFLASKSEHSAKAPVSSGTPKMASKTSGSIGNFALIHGRKESEIHAGLPPVVPNSSADVADGNFQSSSSNGAATSYVPPTSGETTPSNGLNGLALNNAALVLWNSDGHVGAGAPTDPVENDLDDANASETLSTNGSSQQAGAAPRDTGKNLGQALAPSNKGRWLNRTASTANDMIKALSAQGGVQALSGQAKGNGAQIQLQDGTLWSLSSLDRTMAVLSSNAALGMHAPREPSAFGSADLAHAQLVEAMASFSPQASAESGLPPTGSEAYAITLAAQAH